ncbi:MAG: hypothetical protein H6620_08295 [Halobacteriovoraceae bacterium]|nr:hypothetical protein [Halobacteriovoraceae bacterium]
MLSVSENLTKLRESYQSCDIDQCLQDSWLSRWFLLFVYDKGKKILSQPILYEEDFGISPLIKRCKLLPEMVGLVEKIEELKNFVFNDYKITKDIQIYANEQQNQKPAFLFDFRGSLVMRLPFEQKKLIYQQN